MSGGFWDLVNKQDGGTPAASPYGQPGAVANPSASATLVQGKGYTPPPGTGQNYPNPADNWDPKASFADLYKQSMNRFLSGGYQSAYDIMDHLYKTDPSQFTSGTPAARLYSRLKVQLNLN